MTPEHPTPPDLRPLGVGETLDAGFRLLRQNLGAYLKITVGFMILPVVILGVFMVSQIVLIRNGLLYVDNPDSYNTTVVLLGLLARLAQLLCFGVLVHLSTRLYMNQEETAGGILSASRRRFLPFIGLTLLLGMYAIGVVLGASIVGGPFGEAGALLVVASMIAWFTVYSLAAPAFWYEGLRAAKAVGRSRELVKGRFWRVLGSLAVGVVIIGVLTLGLGALVVSAFLNVESPVPYVILTLGLEFVGTAISLMILAPIVTIVYFDGRVRLEGLDMQLQLDDANEDEPPPPVPW